MIQGSSSGSTMGKVDSTARHGRTHWHTNQQKQKREKRGLWIEHKTYVSDDFESPQISHFRLNELPNGVLLLTLSLGQHRPVHHDQLPVLLQTGLSRERIA